MMDPGDIRPLTEFQRNTKASIARLKRTRRPEILTVNGRAALVVLDPKTFATMAMGGVDPEEAAIMEGIAAIMSGKTVTLNKAEATIKAHRASAKRLRRRSA